MCTSRAVQATFPARQRLFKEFCIRRRRGLHLRMSLNLDEIALRSESRKSTQVTLFAIYLRTGFM